MKRNRVEEEVENLAMANYLILLSRGGGEIESMNRSLTRVFECKTCNRQFPSFQALGGHRASHKKPRLMGEDLHLQTQVHNSEIKPKTHECSICGLEFAIGQALGGHMRRHRTTMNEALSHNTTPAPPPHPHTPSQVAVLKKSNSRRVFGLDLNLTPLENDLEFQLGKFSLSPVFNCYT